MGAMKTKIWILLTTCCWHILEKIHWCITVYLVWGYMHVHNTLLHEETHQCMAKELDPFGLLALVLDASVHITTYMVKSVMAMNCVQEYVSIIFVRT